MGCTVSNKRYSFSYEKKNISKSKDDALKRKYKENHQKLDLLFCDSSFQKAFYELKPQSALLNENINQLFNTFSKNQFFKDLKMTNSEFEEVILDSIAEEIIKDNLDYKTYDINDVVLSFIENLDVNINKTMNENNNDSCVNKIKDDFCLLKDTLENFNYKYSQYQKGMSVYSNNINVIKRIGIGNITNCLKYNSSFNLSLLTIGINKYSLITKTEINKNSSSNNDSNKISPISLICSLINSVVDNNPLTLNLVFENFSDIENNNNIISVDNHLNNMNNECNYINSSNNIVFLNKSEKNEITNVFTLISQISKENLNGLNISTHESITNDIILDEADNNSNNNNSNNKGLKTITSNNSHKNTNNANNTNTNSNQYSFRNNNNINSNNINNNNKDDSSVVSQNTHTTETYFMSGNKNNNNNNTKDTQGNINNTKMNLNISYMHQSIIDLLSKSNNLLSLNLYRVSFKESSLKKIINSLNEKTTSSLVFFGIDIYYYYNLIDELVLALQKNSYLNSCFVYLNYNEEAVKEYLSKINSNSGSNSNDTSISTYDKFCLFLKSIKKTVISKNHENNKEKNNECNFIVHFEIKNRKSYSKYSI